MKVSAHRPNGRFPEFVGLMALLISLVALSIDAMLPALSEMARDFGLTEDNRIQMLIPLFLLGVALGQVIYGPLSDSFGRRRTLLTGLFVYMTASVLALVATSITVLLAARILQGLGAAGVEIVVIAIIRDRHKGRRMARVMSFVMAIFVVVPVFAPALGQVLLITAGWRAIFAALLVMAILSFAWFLLRQPETLPAERRIPFTFVRIALGVRSTLMTRTAFGYSLVAGLVFGAFVGYLSTAQQMLQEQYGLGTLFPLYFGFLSLSLGGASLTNARLVMRFGARPLARWALKTMTVLSHVFLGFALLSGGQPPLWSLLAFLFIVFFAEGVLYGNMNALAMEKLGHNAGIGASVVGALSLLLSTVAGGFIGQSYDGTVLPLVAGFGLLSLVALAVMRWVDAQRDQPAL